MVERLKERKVAVAQAWTVGRGRGAYDHSSARNWLDDSSYPIERLGLHTKIVNGSTPSRERVEYWNGDYPWLNSSVANFDRVHEGSDLVTKRALRECHLPIVRAGSVLVAITGQGRTRGLATELMIEATVNQHLAAISPSTNHWVSTYLVYLLRGAYDQLRRISDVAGSTRGALTLDDLKHFRVPRPPLDEQQKIAEGLSDSLSRVDAMLQAAEDAIALMQERRSALISAAVTGRIDPRTGKEVTPDMIPESA